MIPQVAIQWIVIQAAALNLLLNLQKGSTDMKWAANLSSDKLHFLQNVMVSTLCVHHVPNLTLVWFFGFADRANTYNKFSEKKT